MRLPIAALSACALLAGASLAGLGPAAAQTTETQPVQEQAAPAQYTQEQLESFTAAALKVDEIGQRWLPEIQSAGSEEEAQQLREQANQEMVQAVQAEGLTTEEYNQIYVSAQSDPALSQRIAQIIEERRQQ